MRLEHLGVSSLRILTSARLRELDHPVIIHDHSQPIAAIIPYETYLEWQKLLEANR